MKILSIAGRNLNSLKNDFKIDFSEGSLRDCGIFAITGPTGAGKTTLLDAITLALYGKTPRAASDEDIISYGAGEAWAEVVFQTPEGKFKSEWRVRRARNKYVGAIQQSTMEVSSYPDGKILTQKKRDAQDKVKALIKLEYDQFLKSVLLAQGAFKAFLDAKEGERGEMLEKISDTSLYTNLSKKAFDRKRKEEQALELLNASTGNVILLSEESRLQQIDSIRILKNQETEEQKELELLLVQLNWLQKELERRRDVEEAKLQVNACMVKLKEEQPNLKRWEAHQQVARLEPEWLLYLGKINEALRLEEKIQQHDNFLRSLEENEKLSVVKLEVAQTKADQAFKKRLEKLPKILEAITRQGDIIKLKQELEAIHQKNEFKTGEITACTSNIKKNTADLSRSRNKLKELEAWLQQNQYFEKAGASLTGAILLVDQLERTSNDIMIYESTLEKSRLQINQAKEQLEKALSEEKIAEEILQTNSELRVSTSSQLSMLRTRLLIRLNECSRITDSTTVQVEELKNTLSRQNFLAEHLANLHEGEACPLCGSMEHPYQSLSLAEVKTVINKIKTTLKQLQGILADTVQMQRTLENLTGKLDDFPVIEEVENAVLPHSFETDFNELMKVWKSLPEQEKNAALLLASSVQLKQNNTKTIEDLDKESNSEKEKLKYAQLYLADKVEGLKKLAAQFHFDFEPSAPEKLTGALKKCSETYVQNNEEKSVLKATIPQMEEGLESMQLQLDGLQDDLEQLKNEMNTKQDLIQRYSQEISIAHEGYTSPEAARDKLISDEYEAGDRLKQCIEDLHRIQQEKGKIQGEKSSGVLAWNNLSEAIDLHKIALESGLLALGLEADGEIIRNNLLLGTERNILEALYKSLHEKLVLSVSHLKSCEKQLEAHVALAVTLDDAGSITLKISAIKQSLQDINRTVGGLERVIQEDDEKQQRLNEVRNKIKEQEAVLSKWASLSFFIGSADGKRFNQFAQGLTLDRLILVANHHLQLLNDRFLLKRNTSDQGLRLLIIDRYQADNTREINTLSGGESFLVSLALALGLSEMTSKLTTIDSLFIDEGFGTLDADTLETALNALRGLQIGGKTIGIISHVERLKEEIYTQVEITKGADGFSKLRVIP